MMVKAVCGEFCKSVTDFSGKFSPYPQPLTARAVCSRNRAVHYWSQREPQRPSTEIRMSDENTIDRPGRPTGPTSIDGKRRSSLNSRRHQLTAKSYIAP